VDITDDGLSTIKITQPIESVVLLWGCVVSIDELLDLASDRKREIPNDWMPATSVRPLILDDPSLVWLDYFGEANGFKPDESRHDFLKFIAGKGRQFEEKWVNELAAAAVVVCMQDYEVRAIGKVLETIGHLRAGVPAIAKPALWWGQERVYGVPDLIVHTSWLEEKFPQLAGPSHKNSMAANLSGGRPGHYVVFDIKFTTGLDTMAKKVAYANYAAQVRIYSYLLGNLQGIMPQNAYLVTRDRLFDPLPVKITSVLGESLDADLAAVRDLFIEIKVHGSKYRPWKDVIVNSNLSNEDERWSTAKDIIARERVPGRDLALLHEVSPSIKRDLGLLGFRDLDSLLKVDPERIPFEKCKGLGPKRSKVMRAIAHANSTGKAVRPGATLVPPARQYEFFVDYEYLTNVNVDFEEQWPRLEGREMVFMVGVGQISGDEWSFKSFVASAENSNQERVMFLQFIEYLNQVTRGNATDGSKTVLYHWTGAEVWQSRRSSDRLAFAADHALRRLPWYDLQKPFLEGPAALPGAWGYGLKEIAKALGKLYPEIGVHWPESLDEGLRAMVMGWSAYAAPQPLESNEMTVLTTYLAVDCLALFSVLRWLRSCQP
jgi:predicted RecB family nuclease